MKKKFVWIFCIFMSLLALPSCDGDSQQNEEPEVPGPEGGEEDTNTYWETTYSDLSSYVDKNIDEIWAAAGEVTSFRDFKLGSFLGTKFKNYTTGEGGIKQTTEETLLLLTSEANMLIYPIFGIQKKVYCCPIMDKDKFRVEICRNYLPLDFSTLGKYIGANIDEVLQEYYAIGNKILFGTAMSYIYFDSAIDLKGNSYTANFDSDKTLESILEISAYVPEDDQTITRWKDMLQNYTDYNLGTLSEIYVTDAFGDKVQDLDNAQAAFDLYEANGRNNGIIARFETGYGYNSLILNKEFCYVLVRK